MHSPVKPKPLLLKKTRTDQGVISDTMLLLPVSDLD